MKCSKCGAVHDGAPWFHVAHRDKVWNFCSRLCLVDGMGPELNQAVSVKQWIPTAEEEERMAQ